MKQLSMVLLFFFITGLMYGQEQAETLFGNGDVTFGGYGAVETKFTGLDSKAALLVGGRGGLIINHFFSIGLGGYGLVTKQSIDKLKVSDPYNLDSTAYLRVGYGGLHLGISAEPNSLLHITGGLLIGGGWVAYTSNYSYSNHNHNFGESDWTVYNSSAFFVMEPYLGAELNVTSFFRLEASASYRFVSGVELPLTKNSDIGGVSGNLTFKFGKF